MNFTLKSLRALFASVVAFASFAGGASGAVSLNIYELGGLTHFQYSGSHAGIDEEITMSSEDNRLLTHINDGHSGMQGIPDTINNNIDISDSNSATFTVDSSTFTSEINAAIPGTISLVSGNFALSVNATFDVYWVSSADGSLFDGDTDTFDLHITSTATMADIGLVANESATYSFLGDTFTVTNTIPEPSSALLLGVVALGVVIIRYSYN